MTAIPPLVAGRSAVLSMDVQAGIVSIYAQDSGLVDRAASVLTHARRAGMLVVHVRISFRPNLPEVSSRNLLLSAIKSSPRHQQLFEGAIGAIHSHVAPEPDDIVITKHRVNAFAGTELELLLRARDIETLILFGIATSGVVLSTLLHAADADYRLIVVKDCCADLDQEVHACLIDKVFPRQATVVSASELVEAIEFTGQAGPSAV
jgi:nicotinamidase-related amidase